MLVGVGRPTSSSWPALVQLSPCSWGWAETEYIKDSGILAVVPMLVGVGRPSNRCDRPTRIVVPMLVGVGQLGGDLTQPTAIVVPMLVGVGLETCKSQL